jgi:hypothetical protein
MSYGIIYAFLKNLDQFTVLNPNSNLEGSVKFMAKAVDIGKSKELGFNLQSTIGGKIKPPFPLSASNKSKFSKDE